MARDRVVIVGAGVAGLVVRLRACGTRTRRDGARTRRRARRQDAADRDRDRADRQRPDRFHHALGVRRTVRRRGQEFRRSRPPAPAGGSGAPRLERAAPGSICSPTKSARSRRSAISPAPPRPRAIAPSAATPSGSTTCWKSRSCAPRSPAWADLIGAGGFRGLLQLPHIKPFSSMWSALVEHFHDPRLRQLFGRYATYCGSSPFQAPATLMLVAHVEREGVWSIEGGMHRAGPGARRWRRRLSARRSATAHEVAEVSHRGWPRLRACGLRMANASQADAVMLNADVARGRRRSVRRRRPPAPRRRSRAKRGRCRR